MNTAPRTRILVAEDSPVQAELLRRALTGAGFEVELARNGALALEQARSSRPAAIVSDVNMPVMDGYQLCSGLRADPVIGRTPLILVTTLSDPRDVMHGLEAGADAYLTKPYDVAALVSWIGFLLSRDARPAPEFRNVDLWVGGKSYPVRIEPQRMVNLLASTYENAVAQNRELLSTQNALQDLNGTLEKRVREQTAALKDSEQRLRALIEYSSDIVLVVSDAGRIKFAGPSIERICGQAPAELEGRELQEFCHPEDITVLQGALRELRQAPQDLVNFEQHWRHRDGHWVSLEANARNALEDPSVSGFVVNLRDVTDKRLMAQELDQYRRHLEDLVESRTAELADARQRAEAATQAKSAFLANMSHEIRTPMNAILGLTHLLRRSKPRPDQDERLAKVMGAAEHLLSVINDILDLSKLDAGKIEREIIEFDPEQTIQNVCNIVQDKLDAKGLPLIVDLRGMPATLRGDALRLGQILLNFVSNAVKFTESGSITLRAKVVRVSDSGLRVRFEVIDTGVGLTEEQRQRLFLPFEQADISTTRKYGGTGLGLAISRRMVELMGGDIGVESEYGRGSTFWIEVPVDFGSEVVRNRLARVDTVGLRALVVDSRAETRNGLVDILRLQGMNVASAIDGASAMELLRSADAAGLPMGLLLVDSTLPDVDGLEFGSQVAGAGLTSPPVKLLVSGGSERPAQGLLDAAGYFDVLQRPLTPARVYDPVQDALTGIRRSYTGLAEGNAETTLRQRGGARVLLAEDNLINQEVALDLLRSVGIHADNAENGEIAVSRAREVNYDLILMDMHMPVMDGLEAARQIRAMPGRRNVPILAMTANAREDARQECIAAGMSDHIAKPVDPERLYSALLRWLPAVAPREPTEQSEPPKVEMRPIAGLNVQAGLRTVNGNVDLYRRLLRNFSGGRDVTALRAALAEGDLKTAHRAAHSLKGVSGTLGATSLQGKSAALERELKGSDDGLENPRIEAKLAEIESEFAALALEIAAALPGDGKARSPQPPVDRKQARDILTELAGLIAIDDMGAVQLFRTHEATLRHIVGEDADQLEKLINDYLFDEALTLLRKSNSDL